MALLPNTGLVDEAAARVSTSGQVLVLTKASYTELHSFLPSYKNAVTTSESEIHGVGLSFQPQTHNSHGFNVR